MNKLFTIAEDIRIVKKGMRFIESETRIGTQSCIKFVERTNQKNYVYIKSLMGCFSPIGLQGGVQELSLGVGCVFPDIAAHEFIHALGYHHEQTRPDRDEWVKVNFNNIGMLFFFN
jgi:hypothetical protein